MQIGEAHGRVDDRQKNDAIEMDRALVPVIRETVEHDAVLRHPLGEFIGAGADRMGAELTRRLRRLRRHDHAGAVAQLRQQRREGRRQHELHGVVVNNVDARHGADLGLAVRAGQVQVALEAEFHRRGVERLAVVKLDPLPDLHDQALVAVGPLPLGGELRHDVELGADIDELVAQGRKDDAADIGARQGRVEQIGVLGEPDPQARLGRGARQQRRTQQAETRQQQFAHHHPAYPVQACGQAGSIPYRPATGK